jgi:aspartyl-tRNA synthetase
MSAAGATRIRPGPDEPALVVRGWVDEVRAPEGELVVRNFDGLTTLACGAGPRSVRKALGALRPEDVVEVEVVAPASAPAALECRRLEVISRAERLPFTPRSRVAAAANARAKYRYLEFRDPAVQQRFRTRHAFVHSLCCFFSDRGFIGVDTPLLSHPSATGAREFSVVSARDPGVTYALPQSAQVYAQLIVAGGLERYYQLCHCFRDEDLRADRQPEFVQLQLEYAFASRDHVVDLVEEGLRLAFARLGFELPVVPRLAYAEALRAYGTDKPDLRLAAEVELLPFRIGGVEGGEDAGAVATRLPDAAEPDDAWWERVTAAAATRGMRLVGFVDGATLARGFRPLAFGADELGRVLGLHDRWRPGDVAVWLGRRRHVHRLRRVLYRSLATFSPRPLDFRPLWIVDMPLLEVSDENRLVAANHPFVAPQDAAALLAARSRAELLAITSSSFDLVLNGSEVGSGSVVNHRPDVQERILEVLSLSRAQVRAGFAFALEAMRYGAPPIGGFGLGVDRITAILSGSPKIREVMAFPKTKQGYCPVTRRFAGV